MTLPILSVYSRKLLRYVVKNSTYNTVQYRSRHTLKKEKAVKSATIHKTKQNKIQNLDAFTIEFLLYLKCCYQRKNITLEVYLDTLLEAIFVRRNVTLKVGSRGYTVWTFLRKTFKIEMALYTVRLFCRKILEVCKGCHIECSIRYVDWTGLRDSPMIKILNDSNFTFEVVSVHTTN